MRRYIRGHAISIPALRMERDHQVLALLRVGRISIHALRMERDLVATGIDAVLITISIHALRMERDGRRRRLFKHLGRFLSTRSAWSATIDVHLCYY